AVTALTADAVDEREPGPLHLRIRLHAVALEAERVRLRLHVRPEVRGDLLREFVEQGLVRPGVRIVGDPGGVFAAGAALRAVAVVTGHGGPRGDAQPVFPLTGSGSGGGGYRSGGEPAGGQGAPEPQGDSGQQEQAATAGRHDGVLSVEASRAVGPATVVVSPVSPGCQGTTGSVYPDSMPCRSDYSGPVVAGVLGRERFLFDVWGDAINTAARMERHGVPGGVTLTHRAWQRLPVVFQRLFTSETIKVKSKGEM